MMTTFEEIPDTIDLGISTMEEAINYRRNSTINQVSSKILNAVRSGEIFDTLVEHSYIIFDLTYLTDISNPIEIDKIMFAVMNIVEDKWTVRIKFKLKNVDHGILVTKKIKMKVFISALPEPFTDPWGFYEFYHPFKHFVKREVLWFLYDDNSTCTF
jgi:hypothetical protein